MIKDVNIGIALTGSFCTIKDTITQIENIKNEGANITIIVSEHVMSMDTRFGKASDIIKKLEDISEKKVIASITEAERIGPKKLFEIMLIAPCTGNTMAKLANSIIDTTVTMSAKAHLRNIRPLVLSIATNDGLGNSAMNIAKLINIKNIYFVPFGQDDHIKKPNSLVAKSNLSITTLKEALNGNQIQPILV